MPNLEDLGLTEETLPEIDYNAPEPGAFPPKLLPGIYNFTFRLPDDEEKDFLQAQEIEVVQGEPKKKFLQIGYTASIDPTQYRDKLTNPSLADSPEPIQLKFQRASFYQSEKMKASGMNSQGGELLRTLGIRVEPLKPENIAASLRQADGRVQGTADVGWEVYNKDLQVRISTHPNKKKGDQPWPRDAQGRYELKATLPNGEQVYGRETVMRFKKAQ